MTNLNPSDEEKAPEAPSDGPLSQGEVGEVHLMYTMVGPEDSVPVFELSRTLEALGNVIQEGDHVLHQDPHELVVKVRPFEQGSFLMDLVLSIQNNPAVLFLLSHPEATERIKQVLEYLGLIKKANEAFNTVLELIEFLRNGKPERVEPALSAFNYYNQQGQVMPVSQPIHNLFNNGTIQQFFFPALGAPLQRDPVEAIETFLKGEVQTTTVQIPKQVMHALKAYSEPEQGQDKEETLENITTEFLNPKSGTYGDIEGTWTFTLAGNRKNPFHARITDEKFLASFGRGAIRFYHNDLLKVKLRTRQHMKGGKGKITRDIVEVLDYAKAPVQRPPRRR